MQQLIRWIETVTRVGGYVAAVLVIVLMAFMVYEVIVRYAFNAPTMWSYDLSTMTLGAIFTLSIGYVVLTDGHVRVDLLHSLISPMMRPIVDFVGYAFILLPMTIWLTWNLWDHFHGSFLSLERTGTSAWNPLVWPFRAVMFVGAAIWTLQIVAEVLKAGLKLLGRADENANSVSEPDIR
ncbi:MAG: TRAP transporter small permease subunit [Pseudomonadota bacterium]